MHGSYTSSKEIADSTRFVERAGPVGATLSRRISLYSLIVLFQCVFLPAVAEAVKAAPVPVLPSAGPPVGEVPLPVAAPAVKVVCGVVRITVLGSPPVPVLSPWPRVEIRVRTAGAVSLRMGIGSSLPAVTCESRAAIQPVPGPDYIYL